MKGTRLIDHVNNEIALLWYSLRMLVGRNLLAVGFISVVILGTVFSDPVSVHQTRLAILLKQLELFAPLLGIVIFSDLIAGDVQAKSATLLMCSRAGIVPVIIRKLVHGLLITTLTYFLILVILRVSFTSFNLLSAFAIVVPGALFFGMIGLLGATFTSQALAGYAVGTGALILSMVIKQAMPLVPAAYQMRSQLAKATLFADHNWIFAKVLFGLLAMVLAILVVAMAKNRQRRMRIISAAMLLVFTCYGVVHMQWIRNVNPDVYFADPGKQVAVIQDGNDLTVRTAAISVWGRGKAKKNEETQVTDTQYRLDNGRWVEQQQVEYDPSLEYDLLHLDIDANVAPATGGIDARVQAQIKVLAPDLDKLYLHLAWELQVKQVQVSGTRANFSRYGDIIEIPLPESVTRDQTLNVDLTYSGNLSLPGGRHRSERYTKDILFVNSRWYPFVKSWYHAGQKELCTYEALISAPQGWRVGGGEPIRSEGPNQVWRLGTNTSCDRIALAVTRFRHYETKQGDISVTVSGRSLSEAYMQEIAEQACDALRTYEAAFGPYPHRHLAIIEYDYIGAGGVAVPSVVLLNPRRCRPELKWEMLNVYIPHEVAHQWFSSALPTWMAEGSAVYSNYVHLAQKSTNQDQLRFLKGLNKSFQTDKDTPAALIDSTGMAAYIRGAHFMTMLTSVHPQDTIDAVRDFIQGQFKRQLVDHGEINETFIEAMQSIDRTDLGTFVSDWARSTDKFDPAVTAFQQTQDGNRFKVRASLAHREKIRFPVPLRIAFEDGTHLDTSWNTTENKQTVDWTLDRKARSITLDPNHVLLDWDRFNNTRMVSAWAEDSPTAPQPIVPARDQRANWTTYTVAEGLLNNDVRFLDLGAEGQLVAGLHLRSRKAGTYVQCFDGRWTQPDSMSQASGPITAATTQANGTLWAAEHGRIRRIQDSQTTAFTTTQYRHHRSNAIGKADLRPNTSANCNIPGCVIYDMTTDVQDRVWLATDNGLSIVDQNAQVLKHMTTNDGLPGNEVLCMTWQDADTLWIGTNKGCARFDGKNLSILDACPRGIITSLATDTQGTVYIGTYRHGIYVHNDQGTSRIHMVNSRLPHNMITALACDARNRLWVGTGHGLWCVDASEDPVYTRENSGLLSNHITDLIINNNALWIATDAGIAKHDLSQKLIASLEHK
ncbi:MAG: hypothetical protein GY809_04975 [Planctomycetes bacterium]|nr:hypothetical protein [Planctomycetota bacterium]